MTCSYPITTAETLLPNKVTFWGSRRTWTWGTLFRPLHWTCEHLPKETCPSLKSMTGCRVISLPSLQLFNPPFIQQCPMVGWSCSRGFLSGQTVCLNCHEKSAGLLCMKAETQEPRTPEFTSDWPCRMTDLLSAPAHSQTQRLATLSAPDLQLCPGCKTSLTPWDNDFLSWSFPNSHRDLAQGYHRLIPCHSLSWKASLSLIPECALLLQCSRLPIHSARTFKLYPLYTGKWNSSRLCWWYRSYLITTLQRGHIGWHSFFKMVWPSQSLVLSWGWGQYVFGGFNKPLTSKSF